MKSRLVLLLVLVCAVLTVNVSADTFEIPNSEISVQVDGSLDESEWADAGHVQFKAVNEEVIDVKVKYDVGDGALIFGVGCGIITCVIRIWGSYPEGVSFSILFMNSNLIKSNFKHGFIKKKFH